MKLDKFLEHPKFKKYAREVEEFKEEFIKENCEMFLFPNFSEDLKAREYTEKITNKYKDIKENKYIKDFIDKLAQIDKDDIIFIFPEDYSPNSIMAMEISKKAKTSYVIDNIFLEDDTKNWISIFPKNDIHNIGIMFHLIYTNNGFTGDNYGGYKLFGKGLMYYADCLQYNGHRLEPEWPKLIAHFQGNAFRRDTNPRIILEARRVTNMLIRQGYFKNEYELFFNLWKVLLPYLHEMYLKASKLLEGKDGIWKSDINELKSKMVADGIIVSKWKSEQALFTIVKKEYPDALFQFRPRWLEPQNLDIYIPSINLGIEYQGIQHYESVDFFGGEEAFEHRKKLDARKCELCAKNKLDLILWPYTEDISLKKLKEKIKEIKEEH